MAWHLYLGDYETDPPSEENDPTGMRAAFFEVLRELSDAVGSQADASADAAFRASLPRHEMERIRELIVDCVPAVLMPEFKDVLYAYIRQAKEEIERLQQVPDPLAYETMVKRNIASLSLSLSLSIEHLVRSSMAPENAGLHDDASLGWDGVLEAGSGPASDERDDDEPWSRPADYWKQSGDGEDVILADVADEHLPALDERIERAALAVDVDMHAVVGAFADERREYDGLMGIDREEDVIPVYQKTVSDVLHAVLRLSGGRATLRDFLDMLDAPALRMLLDRLPRHEAGHCVGTVFFAIADAALEQVPAYRAMIEEFKADGLQDEDIASVKRSCVIHLRNACGLP